MSRRVIVIGGGVAGLSAACYARMNGYEVDLFERHSIPGGLCTAWRVEGFLFDGCIEWLYGSGPASPYHRLWQEVGALEGRAFLSREALTITTGADGGRVALWADPDRLERELTERSPRDAVPARELCELVRWMRTTSFRVDLADELRGPWDTLKLLREAWPARKSWARVTGTTVGEFARRFEDPLLRQALESSVPRELQLIGLVSTLASLADRSAGYPLGGSLPIAQAMARRCTSLGARLHYRSPVERVRVERGRAVGVELADGRRVDADVVIAAGDLRATLDRLLGGAFPSPEHERLFSTQKLMPAVSYLSFGLRRPPENHPSAVSFRHRLARPVEVAGHTIEVLHWKSFHEDPSMAPAGKTVLIASVASAYGFWERLKADQECYRRTKAELAQGMQALLDEAMPGFSALVEQVDVATPLTFERYTGNYRGRFMTWIPPASPRPPRPVSKVLPGLKGLYLAGMWVAPPGGLPPALKSGRDVVQLLCHADGLSFRAEVASSTDLEDRRS